jgi:endoglucanase
MAMMGSAAGCGASSAEIKPAYEPPQKEAEVGEYEVPQQLPGVLVDQVGYSSLSEKAVVFKGEGLTDTFGIYEEDTGKLVYTGEIIGPVYNEELGEYDSLGYFNDFQQEGRFYAYSDVLGESYSFEIKKDAFADVFDRALKKYYLDVQAGGDTALGCRMAANMLLACEFYPGAFGDDTGIEESGNQIPDVLDEVRREAEWLLKMQDPETGGVNGEEDATISFAGMMAMFSYAYQQYDSAFATEALRAADRAWKYFIKNEDALENTSAFNAAVQLYRATGAGTYSQVLDSYFNREDFQELFNSDEDVFLGSVTYLTINQKVDIEVCRLLMKYLMKRAEDIAGRSSKSPYLVTDMSQGGDFEGILRDMRCLTITDHVIYNHEYTTIIENHVHYLCGMNPEAVNYVTEDTARNYSDLGLTGVMDDPLKNSLLIFMLSVLESK